MALTYKMTFEVRYILPDVGNVRKIQFLNLPSKKRRTGHSRTQLDWILCFHCVWSLFLFSLKRTIIAEHAQSTHYHIYMASSSSSSETIRWVGFAVYMGVVFGCFLSFIGNADVYSKYRQSRLDAKDFTLMTICRIDRIISRVQQDDTSSIITNSTFLISLELTSNNNSYKQEFEEWSVPVALRPDAVIVNI